MYSIPLDNFIYYGNCGVTLSWLSALAATITTPVQTLTQSDTGLSPFTLIFKTLKVYELEFFF